MALADDLERRREEVGRHRENAARLAQAVAVFKSTGQGTVQHPKRISFGLTFIEKPIVSYGCQVDMDNLQDILETSFGAEVEDPVLPVCSGFVTEWDRDDRDFYIGCWIAARVAFPSIDMISTDVMPVIEHHFLFSAIGMKDIPPELT